MITGRFYGKPDEKLDLERYDVRVFLYKPLFEIKRVGPKPKSRVESDVEKVKTSYSSLIALKARGETLLNNLEGELKFLYQIVYGGLEAHVSAFRQNQVGFFKEGEYYAWLQNQISTRTNRIVSLIDELSSYLRGVRKELADRLVSKKREMGIKVRGLFDAALAFIEDKTMAEVQRKELREVLENRNEREKKARELTIVLFEKEIKEVRELLSGIDRSTQKAASTLSGVFTSDRIYFNRFQVQVDINKIAKLDLTKFFAGLSVTHSLNQTSTWNITLQNALLSKSGISDLIINGSDLSQRFRKPVEELVGLLLDSVSGFRALGTKIETSDELSLMRLRSSFRSKTEYGLSELILPMDFVCVVARRETEGFKKLSSADLRELLEAGYEIVCWGYVTRTTESYRVGNVDTFVINGAGPRSLLSATRKIVSPSLLQHIVYDVGEVYGADEERIFTMYQNIFAGRDAVSIIADLLHFVYSIHADLEVKELLIENKESRKVKKPESVVPNVTYEELKSHYEVQISQPTVITAAIERPFPVKVPKEEERKKKSAAFEKAASVIKTAAGATFWFDYIAHYANVRWMRYFLSVPPVLLMRVYREIFKSAVKEPSPEQESTILEVERRILGLLDRNQVPSDIPSVDRVLSVESRRPQSEVQPVFVDPDIFSRELRAYFVDLAGSFFADAMPRLNTPEEIIGDLVNTAKLEFFERVPQITSGAIFVLRVPEYDDFAALTSGDFRVTARSYAVETSGLLSKCSYSFRTDLVRTFPFPYFSFTDGLVLAKLGLRETATRTNPNARMTVSRYAPFANLRDILFSFARLELDLNNFSRFTGTIEFVGLPPKFPIGYNFLDWELGRIGYVSSYTLNITSGRTITGSLGLIYVRDAEFGQLVYRIGTITDIVQAYGFVEKKK